MEKPKGKSLMKALKKPSVVARVELAPDGMPLAAAVTVAAETPVILALAAALGLASVACGPTAGWLAHGQLSPAPGATTVGPRRHRNTS